MPDINDVQEAVAAALSETNTEEFPSREEETPAEEPSEEVVETEEAEKTEEVEEAEEEVEEETPSNPYDLEDAQVAQAVEIYKAISGNKGIEAIKQLARQAGVELAEDKKEAPAPAKPTANFEEILKKHLGERFSFLATPIAEAFKEIDQNQSSRVDAVKQDISINAFKKEIGEEIASYCKETGLAESIKDPVAAKVFELTKKYQFTGSTRKEFREYFAEMHDLALTKLGKSKTNGNNSQAKTQKIKRNLASVEPEAAGTPGKLRKSAPKDLSAEDAVAAALRGEAWG